MTQPNQIQVSVIIVSCNSFPSLNDSLRALAKAVTGVSHELIVVDNASTDESVATVKEHFPQATIIEKRRNLGFAAACNLGAHKAGGEYLLFHNPDLELESDAIVRLLDAANGLERVGALAGRMRFPDSTFQPTCRRFPTLRNMLFSRGSVLSWLAGKSHEYTLPDYEKTTVVPAVAGTLMLIKRKVFEAMGGFDKRFFMYMEDTDLCLRLEQAGYSNYFVPSAGGVHLWGKGSRAGNIRRSWYHHRSVYRYFLKHFRNPAVWFILPFVLGGNFILRVILPDNAERK